MWHLTASIGIVLGHSGTTGPWHVAESRDTFLLTPPGTSSHDMDIWVYLTKSKGSRTPLCHDPNHLEVHVPDDCVLLRSPGLPRIRARATSAERSFLSRFPALPRGGTRGVAAPRRPWGLVGILSPGVHRNGSYEMIVPCAEMEEGAGGMR